MPAWRGKNAVRHSCKDLEQKEDLPVEIILCTMQKNVLQCTAITMYARCCKNQNQNVPRMEEKRMRKDKEKVKGRNRKKKTVHNNQMYSRWSNRWPASSPVRPLHHRHPSAGRSNDHRPLRWATTRRIYRPPCTDVDDFAMRHSCAAGSKKMLQVAAKVRPGRAWKWRNSNATSPRPPVQNGRQVLANCTIYLQRLSTICNHICNDVPNDHVQCTMPVVWHNGIQQKIRRCTIKRK